MALAIASGGKRSTSSLQPPNDLPQCPHAVVRHRRSCSFPEARPARAYFRNRRAQKRWNVPTQTGGSPVSRSMRRLISSAALLVKVRARICRPGTPCCSNQATRCVTTRVLPLPGPARISSGPSKCVTASRWASVNPLSNGSTEQYTSPCLRLLPKIAQTAILRPRRETSTNYLGREPMGTTRIPLRTAIPAQKTLPTSWI